MASQGDPKTEEEPDLITESTSDTNAKESDLNDTLDSKYDSVSGSDKGSEYESVDEDLHVTKKEPQVQESGASQLSAGDEVLKSDNKSEDYKSEDYKSEDYKSEDYKSEDNKSEASFLSEKEEGELSITDDDLSDVHIEEEREEGDGEEETLSGKDKKLDHDEDRRNPQYIPKKGTFYEHDDRTDEGPEDAVNENEEGSEKDPKEDEKGVKSKKEAALSSKWQHDLYNEDEQAPKSTQELVDTYGYDIRNEEAPPKARRHRRYGRGPNKYTRNWEDENAYVKPANPRGGIRGNRRGGGGDGPRRGGGTFFADNENFNLEKEFPELKNQKPFSKPAPNKEPENTYPNKSGSVIKNSVFYNKINTSQQSSPPKAKEPAKPPNVQQQSTKPSLEIKADPGAISGKLHTSRNPPPPAFPPRNKIPLPKSAASTNYNNAVINGSGMKVEEVMSSKPISGRSIGPTTTKMTAHEKFPRGRGKNIISESTHTFPYQQQVGIQHQLDSHLDSSEEGLAKNFAHLQMEPTQHFNTSTASPTTVPMSIPIENHGIPDVNNAKLQQTQVVSSSASSRGKRYSTQRQRSLPESGISFSPPPQAFQQPPQAHYYPPQTYGTQHPAVYTPKAPAATPVLTQQPTTQSPPMQLVYLQPPTQPPPPAQYQAPPPPIINYVPQPFTNPAAAYQQLAVQQLPPPPPQPELYTQPSGITYYSAQTQAVIPRQTPPRRIKAAIPIVPPPENNSRGSRMSMEEEKNARDYYNQETVESSAG